MPFPSNVVEEALVRCGRHCCVCRRFRGTKIETDHIIPESEGGENSLDNCIPLCFDCHAEVKHYNDKHPKGRKFRPEELRRHRDTWFKIWERGEHLPVAMGSTAHGEVLSSRLTKMGFGRDKDEAYWLWGFWSEFYINPGDYSRLSVPYHRCYVGLRPPHYSDFLVANDFEVQTDEVSRHLPPDIIASLAPSRTRSRQFVIDRPQSIVLVAFFQSSPWPEEVHEGAVVRVSLAVAEANYEPICIQVGLEAGWNAPNADWLLITGNNAEDGDAGSGTP